MAATTNVHGFNVGGNNNSFDQRGHFYRGVFSGNVTGMLVKQNSTPNMTVLVEHGSALLNKNTISASIAEIKSDVSVAIDTANTANPRIDSVVIYEDTSVAIPTVEANYWQDGAGGRFKIVSLPGTAAASPVALSDASIQSAVGAGKPFARLADITVPANSTTIVNSNIADKRVKLAGLVPDASVTAAKLDFSTLKKSNSTFHNALITTPIKLQELSIASKRVKISFDGHVSDGNSGAARTGQFLIYRDNVLLSVSGQFIWQTLSSGQFSAYACGTIVQSEDGLPHTYDLRVTSDVSNSTYIKNSSLTVESLI